MEHLFIQSLRKWDVSVQKAAEAARTLIQRYEANGHAYHNLEHIRQTLLTADSLQHLAQNWAAVQLALWFHDVVYDPRAADNEAQSAAYAAEVLLDLGVPVATVRHVRDLILVTKTHEPVDTDGRVVVDADLSILGASAEQYDAYAQAIRQEYSWVPLEEYRAGRLNVLEGFLARPRIYHTRPMRQRQEVRARANIEREMESLKASD